MGRLERLRRAGLDLIDKFPWFAAERTKKETAEFLAIIAAGGWTCHACDDARPDHLIDVESATVGAVGEVRVVYNRRYCTDRPACRQKVVAELDGLYRKHRG